MTAPFDPLFTQMCLFIWNEQIAELFRTTHKVKTQQVARSRGQRCGDIELAAYLADAAGPVGLVLDLCITHERWGSSSNPVINGILFHCFTVPYP